MSRSLIPPISTLPILGVSDPPLGLDHYADDVSSPTPHPSIPTEALARRARLQAILQAMAAQGRSLEPAPLQALRDCLAGGASPGFDPLIAMIEAAHLEEEAGELLRAARREARDPDLVQLLAARLAPLAGKAKLRREAHWHLDTRRQLVRFSFIKEGAASGLDDGDLHAIFLQTFRLEGLVFVLDLAKRPRPLLGAGLPLPAGVGGLAETLDAVFKKEPEDDPSVLLARLNHRLPEGLRIHRWDVLPTYASAVGDLVLVSHWRWQVHPDHRNHLEKRVASFLEANLWPWDRGPSKAEAPLDLRKLIPELHWDEDALCFTSIMGSFQAVNPLKMLGAVLGLAPAAIVGLVRTGVDLKPDLRMGQAERFEPKLKNMYEDAVLLSGGSNIILVDEDDDEPILLG